MDFGAHLPLIDFGTRPSLPGLKAYAESAADLGYRYLCANDHLLFARPWLDGPTALAAEPAAAVTFRIGTNGVSEVLIASSPASASTALAGRLPAECTQYQETIGGKTYTYAVKEQPVTGIGVQAKVLNVHAIGATADEFWSLIYRGKGFVGTVTVVGPNASEQAVQELGEAAYDFAAKSLS